MPLNLACTMPCLEHSGPLPSCVCFFVQQEAAKKHLAESRASLSEKEQLKKETERRVREMEKEVKASRAAVAAGQQQDKVRHGVVEVRSVHEVVGANAPLMSSVCQPGIARHIMPSTTLPSPTFP